MWAAILATMPAACLSLWFVVTRHPLYSAPPHRKYLRQLGGEGFWNPKSILPCPKLESVYFQVLGSFCSQGDYITSSFIQVRYVTKIAKHNRQSSVKIIETSRTKVKLCQCFNKYPWLSINQLQTTIPENVWIRGRPISKQECRRAYGTAVSRLV